MSSDTKILVSYLFIMGLLVPNAVKALNFVRKEIKRLKGEDVWERKRGRSKSR